MNDILITSCKAITFMRVVSYCYENDFVIRAKVIMCKTKWKSYSYEEQNLNESIEAFTILSHEGY